MNMFEAAKSYNFTENGALTYSTTLDACLDLFAMGGALRTRPEDEIIDLIDKAYKENPIYCLCILFYLRDIRGGQGEKRVFRTGIKYLTKKYNLDINKILEICVELGSWKDIFDSFTFDEYKDFVKKNYEIHVKENKYDLMEKWMPTISSSKNALAEKIAAYLGLTPRLYRKYLSKARSYLKVVERDIAAKTYSNIDYSHVPSRAGLLYRHAFMRHDGDRYREYLNQVSSDEKKINVGTLYPYDVVKKYLMGGNQEDSLEVMWKNLEDYTNNENNLVVADVSGSMTIDNYQPLSVAVSLGIYFAERNKGIFHNNLITFSQRPSFITFEDSDNLYERVHKVAKAEWGMNTNLQAVFDLVLNACVREKVPQDLCPKTIYIISDMELDVACRDNKRTNFEEIDRKFREAGYERPNLVFWNVASRQNNVPVRKDENGTALVSGCSPSIFKMAMTKDMNPIKMMEEIILKDRYLDYAKELVS